MLTTLSTLILVAAAPAAKTPAPSRAALIIDAGAYDRQDSIASFLFPEPPRAKSIVLRDTTGKSMPVQLDEHGRGVFAIKAMKAHQRDVYYLELSDAAPAKSPIAVRNDASGVAVSMGGRPLLTYQAALQAPRPGVPQATRNGYLHPVVTPGGLTVTDDQPADHPNHHGIWTAWADAEYMGHKTNFWNVDKPSGRVNFESAGPTFAGPVFGGFHARQSFLDLVAQGKTALREEWTITLYRNQTAPKPTYYFFDLESKQTAIGGEAVTLLKALEGGLALRGARAWASKGAARVLTSEGKSRVEADGAPGRWFFMGGAIQGRPAGIAVLGHPLNFRAPQPMRLAADVPFFDFAPTQAGPFKVDAGRSYEMRYRFVVFDGAPDAKLIERLWNDYAHPPIVSLQN